MAGKTNWTKLNWEDPFELDSQLSDEQRMVRDSARQYAQDQLLPRVKEAFRREETDPCLLYTSPSPRDLSTSRMPSSA